MHQREPFRLGHQPRRHHSHCGSESFLVFGAHARPEFVDRDVAVETRRHRDPDFVGDVGVELDLGEVTERHAFPDGVVLGGQLDRKRGRQITVRRVRRGHAIGGAGLPGADRGDVDVFHVDCEYSGQPLAGHIVGVTRYRHDGGHPRDINAP